MDISRKQSMPNFTKNEHFLPPLIRTYTCADQGVRTIHFSENLACFFSSYLRFEIRPFALLPTNSRIPGAYLGPCDTTMMEPFRENS